MASTNFGKYLAITADETYLEVLYNTQNRGYRIFGTFVGTVAIQIKRPDQAASDYSTIRSVTGVDAGIIELLGTYDIRIGTTAYTSGTVEVEIS